MEIIVIIWLVSVNHLLAKVVDRNQSDNHHNLLIDVTLVWKMHNTITEFSKLFCDYYVVFLIHVCLSKGGCEIFPAAENCTYTCNTALFLSHFFFFWGGGGGPVAFTIIHLMVTIKVSENCSQSEPLLWHLTQEKNKNQLHSAILNNSNVYLPGMNSYGPKIILFVDFITQVS